MYVYLGICQEGRSSLHGSLNFRFLGRYIEIAPSGAEIRVHRIFKGDVRIRHLSNDLKNIQIELSLDCSLVPQATADKWTSRKRKDVKIQYFKCSC